MAGSAEAIAVDDDRVGAGIEGGAVAPEPGLAGGDRCASGGDGGVVEFGCLGILEGTHGYGVTARFEIRTIHWSIGTMILSSRT
jgi:hypothetical protein